MDNRKDNSKAKAGVSSRRTSPIILICSLACALLLGGYFLFATGSIADPSDALAAPDTSASTNIATDTSTSADPFQDINAAVIIDAAESEPAVDAAGAEATADLADPATQNGNEGTIPTGKSERAPHSTAARARSSAKPHRRSKSQAREPDLLTTLLANIAKPQHNVPDSATQVAIRPPSRRARQSNTMDELIAQIQNNRGENYTESATALATIGATTMAANGNGNAATSAPPVSSESVQLQLSRCPRANTVSGIECRKKVCAKQIRQDAACPKR